MIQEVVDNYYIELADEILAYAKFKHGRTKRKQGPLKERLSTLYFHVSRCESSRCRGHCPRGHVFATLGMAVSAMALHSRPKSDYAEFIAYVIETLFMPLSPREERAQWYENDADFVQGIRSLLAEEE